MNYNNAELMTVNAARLLRDGDVVFVGVGLPNLACNLARRTHAPNLVMIYEAGVIGARPSRLPLSIGDPCLVSGATAVCSMYDIFAFYLQRGNVINNSTFFSVSLLIRYKFLLGQDPHAKSSALHR